MTWCQPAQGIEPEAFERLGRSVDLNAPDARFPSGIGDDLARRDDGLIGRGDVGVDRNLLVCEIVVKRCDIEISRHRAIETRSRAQLEGIYHFGIERYQVR